MDFPPGLLYLFNALPRLSALPATVYLLSLLLRAQGIYDAPGWHLAAVCVLSLPVSICVRVIWGEIRVRREAAALGAVPFPQVESKWPGGLDLVAKMGSNQEQGYIGDLQIQYMEKYGYTYNIKLMFDNRIFTTEPEYIKRILATEFANFQKGPTFHDQVNSVLGTGVFNSDGDMWKFHRSMTRPFFSRDRISHFDIFDRHAEDAIAQMKARLREGHAIDFQDLAGRFTLDSATEFLFGQDVRSLSAGLPYPHSPKSNHPANEFAEAFANAQSVLTPRGRYGSAWPLTEFWRDKSRRYMSRIERFVDPILGEAVVKKKMGVGKGEEEGKEGETLLDHLVQFTEDKTILKDEILNMLVAGRDTTAGTLSFVVYMLSQHPDVLKRLREEILSKVGSSRRPTFDDLRDMKYLRAVINETLRLFPIVPFNIRSNIKATTWPSNRPDGKPYYIPAGTRIPYSVFLMHRRKDLWGRDALEFDPDRFIDERLAKYLTPNPFIFLPFNAGPRICLGQQFAYNEMSFLIVRLLQNVSSITLAPDAQPEGSKPPAEWQHGEGRKTKEKVWPKSSLTMHIQGGLWVRMEEASNVETV